MPVGANMDGSIPPAGRNGMAGANVHTWSINSINDSFSGDGIDAGAPPGMGYGGDGIDYGDVPDASGFGANVTAAAAAQGFGLPESNPPPSSTVINNPQQPKAHVFGPGGLANEHQQPPQPNMMPPINHGHGPPPPGMTPNQMYSPMPPHGGFPPQPHALGQGNGLTMVGWGLLAFIGWQLWQSWNQRG